MTEQRLPRPDYMTEEAWEALLNARRPEIIRAGGKDHVRRYIETNGGEGTDTAQGGPCLLLTTIGRKSGNEVTTPVNFMRDGETVYVVGSIAGLEDHPRWVLNLEASPRGWLQEKAKRWPVTARKLTGEDRAAVWPSLTSHFRLWGYFQQYSDREFSVFALTPAAEASNE
jgi:deazaflavin-dependent oxidoreductase (nitroreductase family)